VTAFRTLTNDTRTGQRPLTVATVEENSIRAAIPLDGLREAGIVDVEVIGMMTSMLRRSSTLDPDIIIIGIEHPSRGVLEQMFQASKLVSRPVAMFVDRSDEVMIHAAVEAIVDMAISRFKAFVERPNGILMRNRQFSEEEACALLRQTAMNEKRKLVDIAQRVVTAASLPEK
jgi:two-component system, response regulator / RNA-binding antiterminator